MDLNAGFTPHPHNSHCFVRNFEPKFVLFAWDRDNASPCSLKAIDFNLTKSFDVRLWFFDATLDAKTELKNKCDGVLPSFRMILESLDVSVGGMMTALDTQDIEAIGRDDFIKILNALEGAVKNHPAAASAAAAAAAAVVSPLMGAPNVACSVCGAISIDNVRVAKFNNEVRCWMHCY